ncbi:anti-sigma factor [Actinoplanes sp. G11-F43]|uniref:anti-sigma factor n=1 Tax=Actinoplanes sp. G11-F43 TaxID=3424130 RepID=UPI003D33BAD5
MQHLDPDRLVLLALSEDHEDSVEADHLEHCAGCRHELTALRDVAAIGAQTHGLHDLPPPPDRIWQAIEAGIAPVVPQAPVVDLTAHRRRRPRWLTPVIAAAAAAVLAVAGTVAVNRSAPAQVTARATLAPLPTVPAAAGGDALVLDGGRLRLDVRNLPLTTGFHQVWLIDPDDLTKMIALGNLSAGAEVVLPVPPGTDLNRFRLVDVSDEAYDGDATHSGRSLLRGILTS